MDWDDFKYFSAVARCGTMRAAAAELGVNPSTVTRRLEQFESRLGARLFARTPRGLVLTPAGKAAVEKVQQVETDLARIERSIREEDQALAGRVRIAVPEFMMLGGVLDDYGRVADAYSGIAVDWLFDPAAPALMSGKGDLGVAVTAAPPLDLVGRRIGAVAVTAYAAMAPPGFNNRNRTSRWLEWYVTGAMAEACDAVRVAGWDDAPVVSRCSTLSQLVVLLRAGAGVSALPCIVGDRTPGLRRLEDAPVATAELWLLMTLEMRHARRVRLFGEYLSESIAAGAAALMGESGQ